MICLCPTCGIVFEDHLITGGPGAFLQVNAYRTPCPNGHMANALAGEFTWDKDGYQTFLSGPAFSQDVLSKLKALLSSFQRTPGTKEDFVKRADEILPGFGSQLLKHIKTNQIQIFLAIVAFLLAQGFELLVKKDPSITINAPHNTYNIVQPAPRQQPQFTPPSSSNKSKNSKNSHLQKPKKKRKRK